MAVRILTGDTRDTLASLDERSVQTVVTSPPYFGLRSYLPEGHKDKGREIGIEPTPAEYVSELVAVFRAVRRVLRDDATVFLNLGDSYGPGKQLLGIPWRVAFALQADGWVLRSEIIWAKPNCMPESVTDRPTKAHEQVFLLSKAPRYVYDADAIAEPVAPSTVEWARTRTTESQSYQDAARGDSPGFRDRIRKTTGDSSRNARSVWSIATQPFSQWGEAVRQVPVAWDAVSGDTKRTPSAGCPVHGLMDHRHPTRAGDARADGNLTRSPGTADRPVRVPLLDYAPTALHLVLCSPGESSGSQIPTCAPAATPHSTGSRRMARGPATTPPCTLCVETSAGTARTSASPGPDAPCRCMPSSSTAAGGSACSAAPEILADTAHSGDAPASFSASFGESLMAAGCVCEFYEEVTEKVSHFATMPPALAERCVKAGSRPGDTVLDPFGGAGTTAMVADRLGRDAILCELNPAYAALAADRLRGDAGLFAEVAS